MSAFFMSSEAEGPASFLVSQLQLVMEPELNKLNLSDYGDGLNKIYIISTILKEETLEGLGWRERKYFDRRAKEAGIRLFVDYKKFIRVKPVDRYEMYVAHILECVEIAGKKASKSYRVDALLADVRAILSQEVLYERCKLLTRFNRII